MNVAIYARYSTEEQDPRSIEDQIRRCTEHADRAGHQVVATFADAAVSGGHTERAQLARMRDSVAASKRPPFRAVLVDDLSRLSRNIGDFWRILDDLAARNVNVIDVQTGMSSDAPNARQMFGMKSLFADQMLETIRYQTHRGLQGRAIAGFSTGGSLFGYRTSAEVNADPEHARKLWQIDESEAAIVRRIFAMILDGSGYRAIADVFNREAIAPPRNNGRGGKHGGGWTHISVRAIVLNEKYIGRWVWNATKWTRVPGKRTRRRVNRPETEHVTRDYPELAIIDRTTWDRVHARMARRKHGDERATRKGQQTTLVSGLLRCGLCGGPMSVRSAKIKAGKRYVNYGCTAHSSRGGSICTNSETISAKKISDALVAALREILTGPEVQEAFANAFARRVAERSKAGASVDLDRALAAAQRRVTNATRLLVEDPDDQDIRKQREADRAEVRRIEAELATRTEIAPRTVPDAKKLRAAMSGFISTIADQAPERGREALVRCLPSLTVTPKREGPNRFHVVGSLDLAAVAASGSSGGMLGSLIYRISKVKSWVRTLEPRTRG